MIIVLIGCLVVSSLYLAKRLSDVNAENTSLRAQVASLKRQVVRSRPRV